MMARCTTSSKQRPDTSADGLIDDSATDMMSERRGARPVDAIADGGQIDKDVERRDLPDRRRRNPVGTRAA